MQLKQTLPGIAAQLKTGDRATPFTTPNYVHIPRNSKECFAAAGCSPPPQNTPFSRDFNRKTFRKPKQEPPYTLPRSGSASNSGTSTTKTCPYPCGSAV